MKTAKMTRRDFLRATGAAMALGAGSVTCGQPNTKRPNILFIMSDDHCAQAIGAYGSRLALLNPTPTIDRLAAEGMLFENAFCTNSICTPSRATIMTGQYSQTNGVLTLDERLAPERHTLAIEMKKAGYQTAMIGKWHLKDEPAHFDYYKVLPGQGKYFDPEFREKGQGPWRKNVVKHQGHSSDVITDIALEWFSARRDANRPFFMMLHYKAPHDMFDYAPRYESYLANVDIPEPESLYHQPDFGSVATRGKNDSRIRRIGTSVSKRHPYRNYGQDFDVDPNLPDKEYTHRAYQVYLKKYLRCVKGVDDNLARLFDVLRQQQLMDNTVILYTGDQGFMLGEHDYIDKRWMYEESMRMPLLVRYPKMIAAGSRTDLLVNNTDFAPTMLELAGAEVPHQMQGRSFASMLAGREPETWRTATYYRYWMHLTHHDVPAHFGIRTKRHKLMFYYGRALPKYRGRKSMGWKPISYPVEPTPPGWEFYDLQNDPYELANQYRNPRYANLIAQLKEQLRRERARLNETDDRYPDFQQVIDEHWDD
ncbi:MAG: sulfatase-like hydrolase/transferase [Phycisphaerales bacterium]|nr:MAG: sulfatase-like hydrolase/transferase [Phycisphaerales bacterium]